MIELKKTGFDRDRKTLFVFFTGGLQAEQKKRFDFEGLARLIAYPAVLVRDISGNFYDTPNYDETLDVLSIICAAWRNGDGRVVFVGTSMGGYAAFKFGAVIRPDKITAFAPQIEWPGHPDLSPLYRDLRIGIDIHICRTSNYETDARHAQTMNRIAGATVFVHDCRVHNVAGVLKERASLMDIVLRDA